jgi:hypothetical protein
MIPPLKGDSVLAENARGMSLEGLPVMLQPRHPLQDKGLPLGGFSEEPLMLPWATPRRAENMTLILLVLGFLNSRVRGRGRRRGRFSGDRR